MSKKRIDFINAKNKCSICNSVDEVEGIDGEDTTFKLRCINCGHEKSLDILTVFLVEDGIRTF